ncbi:GerMN domain-containing protein [Effusibacillus dendaii]|uniref:Spore germination protein GerM n=1 Tax=Effusibacillus dendaii TaxID=2743772 RepID=A0A7I8DGN8_9BACL|nr:GerMN domain-containing protein [Effusibacillus dendaii]BCJ88512.1 spore germination protein GerM [Effusibacillus dendaii]
MRHHKKLLAGVLVLGLAGTTGCGMLNKTSSPVSPRPPKGDQAAQPATEMYAVNLYFADEKGFVVPLRVNIPKVEGIANQALTYLTPEKSGGLLTGTGLHALIPSGAKMSVNIKDNLAVVDFSQEVLKMKDAKAEQQLVDSVVWTLTEFPSIKQVQIKVNGNVIPALPTSGTPIGQPLSRANGINLQVAPNINPAETTKLTLYYQGTNSAGNFNYLVPVTRIIGKTNEDLIKTTIAELAAGPKVQGLSPTVSPALKLLSESQSGDTVSLDLDNLLTEGASTEQSKVLNSIVLSVLENTPARKVKITVKGQPPTLAGVDLSKPVSRPQVVNQKQL